MTLSVAKEANTSAGNNGACSDRESQKNECGGSKRSGTRTECRDSSKTGSLCNGGGSGEELLHLWRVWDMACHCRNRGRGRPMEGRRMEYSGGRIEEIFDNANNLKRGENLELLN